MAALFASSLVYYALYDVKLIPLLFASAALTYAGALLTKRSALYAYMTGALLIAVLVFLKSAGSGLIVTVGVSFYTLRLISFLAESVKDKQRKVEPGLFLTYVFFFPVLSQGPIVTYEEMKGELKRPSADMYMFREGMVLFILGLCKKVLLADAFSPVVASGFDNAPHLDFLTTLMVMVSYSFELYFDFSGYCDMAMGSALMLGIRLPVNFDKPYLKCSVREFWRSWHITLVRFFTDHVYRPMGGGKSGFFRQAVNIMAVFVLSALWHGFGLTYLVWGLLEGLKVVISHGIKKAGITLPKTLGWALTYGSFLITLMFFRAKDLTQALTLLKTLTVFRYPGFLIRVSSSFYIPEMYLPEKALSFMTSVSAFPAFCLMIFLILSVWFIRRGNAYDMAKRGVNPVLLALLFVSALISLSGVSTFLYFRY